MNTLAALTDAVPYDPPPSGERLEALLEAIRRNRFLPAPSNESIFVGDGDFRAIGLEFLRHFIELGRLTQSERVLDIGCGIGRMALPLTQYLDPDRGRYDGIDPVAAGIDWCLRTVTPVYPNFRFVHLDIAHPLYNPNGCLAGHEVRLPYADESFDFVIMTSVVTHLPPEEIGPYFEEIGRLLAPGGRLFLSAFVIDAEFTPERSGRDPRLGFERYGNGPAWFADPDAPLGAVAFDDLFLDGRLEAAGLSVTQKRLGHWRGGKPAAHYQDFIVATKPAREA